jgi:hypothetical protein
MSEANPLLSNRTMQGAAKAVEGLLDQGNTSKSRRSSRSIGSGKR